MPCSRSCLLPAPPASPQDGGTWRASLLIGRNFSTSTVPGAVVRETNPRLRWTYRHQLCSIYSSCAELGVSLFIRWEEFAPLFGKEVLGGKPRPSARTAAPQPHTAQTRLWWCFCWRTSRVPTSLVVLPPRQPRAPVCERVSEERERGREEEGESSVGGPALSRGAAPGGGDLPFFFSVSSTPTALGSQSHALSGGAGRSLKPALGQTPA